MGGPPIASEHWELRKQLKNNKKPGNLALNCLCLAAGWIFHGAAVPEDVGSESDSFQLASRTIQLG